METRANYIVVGIFTIVAILSAFGFVYWKASSSGNGENVTLNVHIPGSAAGLGRGSAVLFNGVKVGDVVRVYIDVTDPDIAIAETRVDRRTPVTPTTQAEIGVQGLTGQAYIELIGGNPKERNILEKAAAEGVDAEITAKPYAVTDLLKTAQNIADRADQVLESVQTFFDQARTPLNKTLDNAQKFSEALARNSDGIDKFLESVSELSTTVKTVSTKLDSTLTAAQDILQAVDSKKVGEIVDNTASVTARLNKASEKVGTIVDDTATVTARLNKASEKFDDIASSVDETVHTLNDTALKMQDTLAGIDKVTGAVDPDRVASAIANIDQASSDAKTIAQDFAKVAGAVDPDRVASAIANIDEASSNAKVVAQDLAKVVGAVDPDRVSSAIANIDQASRDAKVIAQDFAKVSEKVGQRAEDIDQIIADTRQIAERLNEASQRVDGVLQKVDSLLGSGSSEDLFAQASETLKAYRELADTLNAKMGTITDGLARFSGQGLRDVEALVRDSRRSVNRIEQAISDLQRNPQRIISGGAGEVRQYDGRVRR